MHALLVLAFLAFYFLPTWIAQRRDHPSTGGIFVINLLLGLTGLGWIFALAWSLSGAPGPSPSQQHTTPNI